MSKIKNSTWFSTAVLILGICFIVAGVMRNEVDTMFEKAINICLECVGIG